MRGILALSFVLTFIFTPLTILILRRFQVFDVPTERSSHVRRTLRGGGIAVALGAVSGVLLAGSVGVVESWSITTLLVCTSFFAMVGFIDDVRTLEVKPRLASQLGCALVFVAPWFFVNVPLSNASIRLVLAVIAVIWVIGFLNAFNFMDGINGISSLHAILIGATFFVIGMTQDHRLVAICGAAVAASAAGFLPFNFPIARVFLGDVGSYFLGTWLALTALIALIWASPVEAVVAPFLIYLADTSFTLMDRIRRGEDWRKSHHDHIYQRLIEHRWSHTRAALVVVAFSTVCALLGLVSLTSVVPARVAADVMIVPVVVLYLMLPRLIDRYRSRREPLGEPPELDRAELGAAVPVADASPLPPPA